MEKFKNLGLTENTLSSITKKGFEEPTEVQALTIPLLLEDQCDIIAQAQTGTGKTAAFGLPLIEMLEVSGREKHVQAIILAPTRELVIQVCEEINSLKGEKDLTIIPIYGGQSIEMQLKKLKKGVSVVVGTPGRVLDHIRRKTLKLSHVKYFILDEADEMLNMGFIEDIETVFEATPEEKRVLLFSATMPIRIKKMAEKYMGKYQHVKTENKLASNLTDQIYFEVLRKDKFEALCRIIDIEDVFYGIIFCRTKTDVDDVVSHLVDRGYLADGLHGDISQNLREKILNKFRRNYISILVATDVAARGIDVNNLTHVINYSIPHNPEAYIHRIGRTGRAGKLGTAITFITPDEFRKLGFIKRVTKTEIKRKDIPQIKEIISKKQKQINSKLLKSFEKKTDENFQNWAKDLLSQQSAEVVLSSLLQDAYGQALNKSNYLELSSLQKKNRQKESFIKEGKTRLFIAKGKMDKINKRELISFIVKKAKIEKKLIDQVEIRDRFSFISVPFKEAEIIIQTFKDTNVGKKSLVEKASQKSSSAKKSSSPKKSSYSKSKPRNRQKRYQKK